MIKDSIKAWLPTLSLSFAGFIFVTTEFIPVGLLPDIAIGLGKSEAFTGLLMTIYAWIVATMSLPLTVYTANWERRQLTLTLLSIFIAAHIVAGVAMNFEMLLLSRIAIALSHAVFWSITTPLAVRVAPEGKKTQALAVIATGTSLGNILGIPFGTFLGHSFGWRMAFVAIAICALVVLFIAYRMLPLLPSTNAGSFKSLPSLFRRPALVLTYVLTVVTVTGHFTAFTYINPFLQKMGGFSADTIVSVLLVFGCSGILGSIIASRCINTHPKLSLSLALVCMMLCLVLFAPASSSLPLIMLLCVAWGTAMTVAALVFQTTVLAVASDAADVAVSMYSGIFNIGIGTGALFGSLSSTNHLGSVGYFGAGILALSVLVSLFLPTSRKETKPALEM